MITHRFRLTDHTLLNSCLSPTMLTTHARYMFMCSERASPLCNLLRSHHCVISSYKCMAAETEQFMHENDAYKKTQCRTDMWPQKHQASAHRKTAKSKIFFKEEGTRCEPEKRAGKKKETKQHEPRTWSRNDQRSKKCKTARDFLFLLYLRELGPTMAQLIHRAHTIFQHKLSRHNAHDVTHRTQIPNTTPHHTTTEHTTTQHITTSNKKRIHLRTVPHRIKAGQRDRRDVAPARHWANHSPCPLQQLSSKRPPNFPTHPWPPPLDLSLLRAS